jgi:hypothetical protein
MAEWSNPSRVSMLYCFYEVLYISGPTWLWLYELDLSYQSYHHYWRGVLDKSHQVCQ